MQSYQFFGQWQANSIWLVSRVAFTIIEFGKYLFDIFFRNSDAFIFHFKYEVSATLFVYRGHAHIYFFMFRSIFDSIGK